MVLIHAAQSGRHPIVATARRWSGRLCTILGGPAYHPTYSGASPVPDDQTTTDTTPDATPTPAPRPDPTPVPTPDTIDSRWSARRDAHDQAEKDNAGLSEAQDRAHRSGRAAADADAHFVAGLRAVGRPVVLRDGGTIQVLVATPSGFTATPAADSAGAVPATGPVASAT